MPRCGGERRPLDSPLRSTCWLTLNTRRTRRPSTSYWKEPAGAPAVESVSRRRSRRFAPNAMDVKIRRCERRRPATFAPGLARSEAAHRRCEVVPTPIAPVVVSGVRSAASCQKVAPPLPGSSSIKRSEGWHRDELGRNRHDHGERSRLVAEMSPISAVSGSDQKVWAIFVRQVRRLSRCRSEPEIDRKWPFWPCITDVSLRPISGRFAG